MNFQKYQEFRRKHYKIRITLKILFCKLQDKRTDKIRKLVKEPIEGGGEDNDKNGSSNVSPK